MTNQQELIPMRPGDILRFEREQKGLTLQRASERSRMKRSVLSAIETGETGEIPSVYLKGYIRNYARFLGVDPAELEDQMQYVRGAEPQVRTVFTANSGRGNTEKWLKTSSYLAASVLIAALAWQFTHEAVRFSQGGSELNSSTTVEGEPGDSASDASPSQARPPNTHLNASIASVEVMKQQVGPGGSVSAGGATEGTAQTNTALTGQHRLSVTTSADTWVEILDQDGQHLEMDLIRAGTRREYSGQGPFRVMIGRASAVVLTLNGEVVDLGPHTRGNVVRVTLGAELTADSKQSAETESR